MHQGGPLPSRPVAKYTKGGPKGSQWQIPMLLYVANLPLLPCNRMVAPLIWWSCGSIASTPFLLSSPKSDAADVTKKHNINSSKAKGCSYSITEQQLVYSTRMLFFSLRGGMFPKTDVNIFWYILFCGDIESNSRFGLLWGCQDDAEQADTAVRFERELISPLWHRHGKLCERGWLSHSSLWDNRPLGPTITLWDPTHAPPFLLGRWTEVNPQRRWLHGLGEGGASHRTTAVTNSITGIIIIKQTAQVPRPDFQEIY